MLVSAVTLSCALLFGQVEAPDLPPHSPPALVLQPASNPLPVQDAERLVVCLEFAPTKEVPSGRWRAQCDHETRTCLITPSHELDPGGTETERLLERVRTCVSEIHAPVPGDSLKTYQMVPSIADAPPGWYRDERGRVMQFNFDLHRRIWLGGAWSPLQTPAKVLENRVRLDFGISLEFPSEKRMHRMRMLETELFLGEPSVDTTLFQYDFSVERDEPLFRVTTFVGKPRRHDISLNVGTWIEVLRVEELERGGLEGGFLTWGTVHATLDLWHSKDLVSFVRVRAGPSAERDYKNNVSMLVPGAVLEGDLTLDRDGFHHLRFGVEAEKLLLSREVEGRPLRPERLKLSAGYELILLAINDQPLSLVADARGSWRNDIPNLPPRWEWSASAGLRFSLWAPARRTAPMADQARN